MTDKQHHNGGDILIKVMIGIFFFMLIIFTRGDSMPIMFLNEIDDNLTTNETTYSSYKIESFFENLNGTGNAYVCVNQNGTLYRNVTGCS